MRKSGRREWMKVSSRSTFTRPGRKGRGGREIWLWLEDEGMEEG